MKIYEVVTIKNEDEFVKYLGADRDIAFKAYCDAKANYECLTDYDKANTSVEARVYDIADDVDIENVDELNNAIIDSIGYDEFAENDEEM